VPRSAVRILSGNSIMTGSRHCDTLFYALQMLDPSDAALTMKDENAKSHSIAVPCSKTMSLACPRPNDAPCSVEFPDNESLSVMALLNQIWALQKESSTGPGAGDVVGTP